MIESIEPQVSAPNACKIVVVLHDDLEPWKRLNVTAFTVGGVAAAPGVAGARYEDASGQVYLPMLKEPVLVFGATTDELRRTAERARSREVSFSIFTADLFGTFNDEDNRAAVLRVASADLDIVGIAFRCEKKLADKILKGLKLLR